MITLERDPTRAIGIRPAVSAIIFDRRGRLLLQQRSDGGQWGLPGGSVEIGESVREAVAREVREETGLTVAARRLVGLTSPTKCIAWVVESRRFARLLGSSMNGSFFTF